MSVNRIRYERLGYVALNVTDLERSTAFYENVVGLDNAGREGDMVFLRCSDDHHDILLTPGSPPGLKRVAWQMEDDAAFTALKAHFTEAGTPFEEVAKVESDALHIGTAIRSIEPTTGTIFEFYVDMAPAPEPWQPGHTKIARLGHVVIASPDNEAMQRYMMEHLNFRVSDRIEESVTFMRCFPNPYHHSLGIGRETSPTLNHVNFMVSEIDDIGKAQHRLKRAASDVVFGPGRHPPSDSIFLYFLDPDGITVEYSFGMEEFAEDGSRDPRLMPKGLASIDYWGAVPDARFGKIGTIETLPALAGRPDR